MIRKGQVRINKKRCKPFDRLYTGDIIRVPPCLRSEPSGLPRSGPLDIIFENKDFLVLNKPGNLPVHPGTGHTDTLAGRVAFHCRGSRFKPVPVHRLDKNTSGLILFAKSYSWLREIHENWRSGQIEKVYLVWVKGKWKDGPGPMTDRLLRCQDRVRVDEDGKQALSRVAPVLTRSGQSLLLVSLATGRNHQIRVQLAQRGFPVIGDGKYGPAGKGADKMFLHSFILTWPGYRFALPPDWPDEFRVPEDIIQAG